MANRRDDYMNKRSWLIDTAETPADKKRLKAELAKLDKKFNPNRVASTSKSKSADGSDTKPYNVRPIKPSEIIQDKPKAKTTAKPTAKAKPKTTGIQATKKAVERVVGKAKFAAGMRPTATKITQKKTPMKPGTNPKPKTPVKKKVVQMPSKISPSKMTPAQKAKYLANPERYDG